MVSFAKTEVLAQIEAWGKAAMLNTPVSHRQWWKDCWAPVRSGGGWTAQICRRACQPWFLSCSSNSWQLRKRAKKIKKANSEAFSGRRLVRRAKLRVSRARLRKVFAGAPGVAAHGAEAGCEGRRGVNKLGNRKCLRYYRSQLGWSVHRHKKENKLNFTCR